VTVTVDPGATMTESPVVALPAAPELLVVGVPAAAPELLLVGVPAAPALLGGALMVASFSFLLSLLQPIKIVRAASRRHVRFIGSLWFCLLFFDRPCYSIAGGSSAIPGGLQRAQAASAAVSESTSLGAIRKGPLVVLGQRGGAAVEDEHEDEHEDDDDEGSDWKQEKKSWRGGGLFG